MSWIIRDPPSPLNDNSSNLEDTHPKPERKPLTSSPTPKSHPPRPLSPPPFLPPTLRLDLVEEQWSTNPLQIKSTFSTAGTGIQSLTSPACGMGWCFNLDLPAEPASRGGKLKKGGKKPVGRPKSDINTVRMLASLRSSPVGFQPGTLSIRASFRRGDCVIAVLDSDQQNLVRKGQSAISLGRCDIPLPLDELFIDVDVTIFLQSGPVEDPQKLSESMSKAIRASLDGNFPVDVKFMLFSRKIGGTYGCRRRPIYASSSILKCRNSFLDSYMDGSRDSDGPPPGVCQSPYDEDSDLESDLDEDPPATPKRLTSLPESRDRIHFPVPYLPSLSQIWIQSSLCHLNFLAVTYRL